MKTLGLNLNLLLSLTSLLLWGCSPDIELPDYAPLAATPAELSTLYKLESGPHALADISQRELKHQDGRTLPLRVLYPETEGRYPVLLFSHGNWSDTHSYDAVVRHWASHGYVIIMPLHLDGDGAVRGIFNSLRYGQMGLIRQRIEDIQLIFDTIDAWPTGVLKQRMDLQKIAASGHSFGAFTAQQLGGARALDDETGQWYRPIDPRFKAIVALSPPGPMFDVITEQSWQHMETASLISTGTWDVNKAFFPDWQLHRMSFDTAPAGDQFALLVQGMDHYLGNLICRPKREATPQRDQLKILLSTSTAFLDAYVKELPAAQAYLSSHHLHKIVGSFAELKRK